MQYGCNYIEEIYETGIAVFDNEQRKLVAEANRLYEAIRDKRGKSVRGNILTILGNI